MALRTLDSLLILEQLASARHIALVDHCEIAIFLRRGQRNFLVVRRRVLANDYRLGKVDPQNAERHHEKKSSKAPLLSQDHRPWARLSANYLTCIHRFESIIACLAASSLQATAQLVSAVVNPATLSAFPQA